MADQPDLAVLEQSLRYRFRRREPLVRALTHTSWAYEQKMLGRGLLDNEQLEFLGDAILGFLVSESLLYRFPSYPEGRLSKLKSYLVSAAYLNQVARKLDLGAYLLLGRGEELSGGRHKKGLLGDAVEAVLAAIYLDGGIEPARQFVETHVIPGPEEAARIGTLEIPDYKTTLKELAQSMKLAPPRYSVVKETGPGHAKVFTVEVRLGPEWSARAEGTSKKSAEQAAARMLLAQIESAAPAG
jgi:ribonuclease-3